HRGHAPGDIPLHRPTLYVCVRVDQTRDHRLADQADLSGAPRHVDLVHARDGLDVAALDQDEGVLHRLAAGAVDQRGACERDDTVSRRPAGRNQEDKGGEQAAGRTEALHRGSLDVWSCRISQRSPRFCRSNVNGPPATTESPRFQAPALRTSTPAISACGPPSGPFGAEHPATRTAAAPHAQRPTPMTVSLRSEVPPKRTAGAPRGDGPSHPEGAPAVPC